MNIENLNGLFLLLLAISLPFFPAIYHFLMTEDSESNCEALSDQAIEWLVLLRSGSANTETYNAFKVWLAESPDHQAAFSDAQALWGNVAQVMKATHSSTLPQQTLKRDRPAAGNESLAMAAILLIGVWIAWTPLTNKLHADYSTSAGEQKQVLLADGSTVFLNTDTAIAVELSKNHRRIELLKGQAQFTVAKEANRSFDVLAGAASVRALGTVFEVYRIGEAVDVTVSEHAVAVSLNDKKDEPSNAPLHVETGERLHYLGHGEFSQLEQVNLNQLNAWRRGKLIFKDQPLSEVVTELNRYSKAYILLQDDTLSQLRVSGVFSTDALATLNVLQQAFPIRSTRIGSWLVVLHS